MSLRTSETIRPYAAPHSPGRDGLPSVQVLEGAPHGILIASTEREATTVYANGRLAEMFGAVVPTEPGGLAAAATSFYDRNGEPLRFPESPLGIALGLRRPARAEVRYRPEGGQALWLDISASPLDCGWSELPLAVAYVHDVSQQRQSAGELDEVNRRLAEQLEDITWVHSLTERLTDHDSVDGTLHQVLGEGARLLEADMGVARLRDEEGSSMETRALHGLPADVRSVREAVEELQPGKFLVDEAEDAGGVLIVEDVETDPSCSPKVRALGRAAGFRRVYALALSTTSGRRLGVLAWAWRKPGRPTVRQRQLVGTYCRFAGQMVENNLLYERERRIAGTLQQSMLAQTLPEVAGVQIAACSLPGARGMQAGGDWYDVMALPGGKAGLALGDVMGKGLRAATAMGQLRTALRSYALVEGEDPVAVLSHLNALSQDMSLTDLATVLYMTVDPHERRAVVASAGHCPPLLVDHSGARFLRAGQGVPLGVVDEWDAEADEFELPPGALLVLYTDGLVERRGEELGVGLERLRTAALAVPSEVGDLCGQLVDACLDDGEATDDVAILAVRVR
ncbi:SpoIIE family protein phosphatase [Streptomyces sp. RKAG290]|uniref:SpoIIE family protein phosphatase n=1 Tax=Streptomyces sp. RKAG290 TaxID=2888348 RepID=UPI0020346E13|nr:SpoIIE family protein phosphatase [Streptomyces sp. RKAG290]MCM2413862.1 SpoIIE family protein phosphatase [Streptomyces sp. RKAG290]